MLEFSWCKRALKVNYPILSTWTCRRKACVDIKVHACHILDHRLLYLQEVKLHQISEWIPEVVWTHCRSRRLNAERSVLNQTFLTELFQLTVFKVVYNNVYLRHCVVLRNTW